MKTVQYKSLGGYEVIEIADREVRAPGPGEVRITVKAAAVNPTDILMRERAYNTLPLPWIPGMDAAGVVESVGAGVTRVRVGDQVMAAVMPARPDGGAQSARIVVPEASVLAIPKGVSVAEASTLPMNGLTATLGLEISGLTKGQTLAVSGGAGLLAHYTIAVAKHLGIKVIADAKPSEFDLVRSYGADFVVERGPGFCAAIRKQFPSGVDGLFDTALLLRASFPAIRDGGVYIPVRGWDDTPTERGIRILPVIVGQAIERTDMLMVLRGLVESGKIKLRVTREYAPEEVAEAQRALMAGGLRGRPVIVF